MTSATLFKVIVAATSRDHSLPDSIVHVSCRLTAYVTNRGDAIGAHVHVLFTMYVMVTMETIIIFLLFCKITLCVDQFAVQCVCHHLP